jgi:integrase
MTLLSRAVQSYLMVRRAAGFCLDRAEQRLTSFARFSRTKGYCYVNSEVAIEWARSAPSQHQRARHLGDVIRFAKYMCAEDARHQIPPRVFGRERRPRPTPYILSDAQIRQIIRVAKQTGRSNFRQRTYSTFFALLSCTGMRVSEAIRLRYDDITPDGLVIRCSKFRKSRFVALHPTARIALEKYLQKRRQVAPGDDHVFVSLACKPLHQRDVSTVFQKLIKQIGLPCGRGQCRPTPHSLRHSFAVRALRSCSDDRSHIRQHMLMLSTYLGHSKVDYTYWYLEAVPELMRRIARRCESHFAGGSR